MSDGQVLWFSEPIAPGDLYHHGVRSVLLQRKTEYQDMLIVETAAYGKALILDGQWQSAVGDEFLYHEPLVHPACVCQGRPRNVLILGGGEGATLREVLRWKTVQHVVMVDIDAEVIEACKQHLPEMHQGAFDDPRTELVIGNALEYLNWTDRLFDVVISDLSDPMQGSPSIELFTKETFAQAQRALEPGGYFVVQAGAVAPLDMQLHARLVKTLETVFTHVASYVSFVPTFISPWGFAMGSAGPIDTRPDPRAVDCVLEEHLACGGEGLRMFDGTTWLGMFQLPRHLRQAIESEPEVYTAADSAQAAPSSVNG